MLDLAITNGLVVDGTGAAARRADVGVRDGRVVAVGSLDETAERTLDADGQVVAPGFVDVHTHLDAQAFWDPTLSPSPLHGVTTAIAGNCGFSIAPLSDPAGAYLVPMLARVEGMPLTSLREGVPWDWKTTGEYLDRLQGTLAVNAGFMVGHSALRRVVMGEAANERAAEPDEVAAMARLLREGIEAGGLGFSTTTSETHNDADGRPVPSRFADEHEFVELARVCGDYEGTSLELLPRGVTSPGAFDPEIAELMIHLSEVARRPLNWNVISPSAASLDTWLAKLGVGDQARARGAKVIGLTMPVDMKARFSFHAGFVLDVFEGWAPVLALPIPERLRALEDPAVRARMAEGAARTPNMGHLAAWERLVIVEAFTAQNKRFEGRRIGDIAAEVGTSPFDALLDIAVGDGLRTTFARATGEPSDDDWSARQKIWRDPRAMIGASDAGAHLDMIAAFRYSTGLLEEAVRRRKLLSLEEAVRKLTADPARLYGLRDRGAVRAGAHADVVVFDPEAVSAGSVTTRFDLPGGAGRLYGEPSGIAHVIVGGTEIVAAGEYTGEQPGTVLRSGRDTATPTLDL
jgi:N-acyl-D-aspartate/D-glutamate deacylase